MAVWTPRLTSEGMQGSQYWYSNENIFYASGYPLPNCTTYCFGRWWEAYGKIIQTPTGNGEDWYAAASQYGLQTGNEPQVGAIICLGNGPYSGLGHVAVCEKVENGTYTFSNSAYNGAYFYLRSGTRSNNYGYAEYDFQGFIYSGEEPSPPHPPTPQTGRKMPLMYYLKLF